MPQHNLQWFLAVEIVRCHFALSFHRETSIY
nr:MAG TPA: hypothetical protein [Caudoviricetes sp.]